MAMSKPKHFTIILQIFIISLLCFTPSKTDDSLFCQSWQFSVETNSAVNWTIIPGRCYNYVKDYMTGDRYKSDTEFVAKYALQYAKSLRIGGDGKDSWVFDVDETLINHLPYFETFGFGSKVPSAELQRWLTQVKPPALQSSLSLYKDLQQLGFTIFVLTGRPETLRNVTESILLNAGYTQWERLIMRGPSDTNKLAIDYKSEKRKQLEDEGYLIHGNMGDQWSDLLGFAIANRSFKVPNPIYYVS